jgi:hypothetical protein
MNSVTGRELKAMLEQVDRWHSVMLVVSLMGDPVVSQRVPKAAIKRMATRMHRANLKCPARLVGGHLYIKAIIP